MIKEYFSNLLKTRTYTANVLAVIFGFTLCLLLVTSITVTFSTGKTANYDVTNILIALFKDVILLVIGAILRGNNQNGKGE